MDEKRNVFLNHWLFMKLGQIQQSQRPLLLPGKAENENVHSLPQPKQLLSNQNDNSVPHVK